MDYEIFIEKYLKLHSQSYHRGYCKTSFHFQWS